MLNLKTTTLMPDGMALMLSDGESFDASMKKLAIKTATGLLSVEQSLHIASRYARMLVAHRRAVVLHVEDPGTV